MHESMDFEIAVIGTEILREEARQGSESAREYIRSALRVATETVEKLDVTAHYARPNSVPLSRNE